MVKTINKPEPTGRCDCWKSKTRGLKEEIWSKEAGLMSSSGVKTGEYITWWWWWWWEEEEEMKM